MKKYNPIKSYTGLLIRIDDISENMNWKLMKRCEKLFNRYDIKPLLGVIPNNKDKEFEKYEKKENFWGQVRAWQDHGWEISMHGFNHVYDNETNKEDFFGYGGRSEFFGHTFEHQNNKIQQGLKIFKNEGINIRSFFAPNHTYDKNTFEALKKNQIYNIIDGYGLMPYKKFGMIFIPQLFYKEIFMPFGIQCTQIHLNFWKDEDFELFQKFIKENEKRLITLDEVLGKTNNNVFYKILNFFTEKTIKFLRYFR